MPHPRILKALGMTPQQWGSLPIEKDSPERNDLKKKALAIIADEDKATQETGLHARVDALEKRVSALEKPRTPAPPAPPTPPAPPDNE